MAVNHPLFEKYIGIYKVFFSFIFDRNHPYIKKILNNLTGDNILEIGVGTGDFLPEYQPNHNVSGIDISQKMIDSAKEKKTTCSLDLQVMDATQMSFADDHFDLIICKSVITVVESPQNLVQEMKRVLKPGGKIIIVSKFQQNSAWSRFLFKLSNPITAMFFGYTIDLTVEYLCQKFKLELEERIPVPFLFLSFQDVLLLSPKG